jgi:type II secretory pathway pseudopilin PulG
MSLRSRIVELVVVLVIVLATAVAWLADRRDRAKLAAELATAKQTLSQLDAQQHDRDAQLTQTLSAIAALKRTVTTPTQIVQSLPQQIPLPQPITLQTPKGNQAESPATSPSEPNAVGVDTSKPDAPVAQPEAQVPSQDLKPLYDFILDCKACQAQLSTTQADLADEKSKTATLTQERDAALKAAKGGSVLRRVARAAKWFLLGAAAGAIATRAAR